LIYEALAPFGNFLRAVFHSRSILDHHADEREVWRFSGVACRSDFLALGSAKDTPTVAVSIFAIVGVLADVTYKLAAKKAMVEMLAAHDTSQRGDNRPWSAIVENP
jgi:hypothetical protein